MNRNWLLGLLLVAPGCREELGPEVIPTTRVSGFVREGLRPVTRGWVEFTPFDGALGNIRSAPIRPDGSFAASGVAIGPNMVDLVNVPFDRGLRTIHCTTPRVIPDGLATTLMFDTLEEALRRRP